VVGNGGELTKGIKRAVIMAEGGVRPDRDLAQGHSDGIVEDCDDLSAALRGTACARLQNQNGQEAIAVQREK